MPDFATFTSLVRDINSRVASTQYATIQRIEEEYLGSELPEGVNRHWAAKLLEYHHELDRLREDWALEITGRYELFLLTGITPSELRAFRKSRPVLAWLSKRLAKRIEGMCYSPMLAPCQTWLECYFYEQPHFLPLTMAPVQKQYIRRKKDIDAKYYRLLGYWNYIDKDRNAKE